jgi:hypothetical protein
MRKNDYSQIITDYNERYVILSTEGISHWLEYKSSDDIISLRETKLQDVIRFEPKGTCVYMRGTDTVDEARERFTADIGKRVASALVSEHGRSSEKPINIITPWDFVAGALSVRPGTS